jgi:hypothetical protein
VIRAHHDYRYGLVFDGFQFNYLSTDVLFPDAGLLSFAIQFRNFSPGPIKYMVESFDVRIGTRALPKPPQINGFLARGSGRTSRYRGFLKANSRNFTDKVPSKERQIFQ